MSRTIPRKIWIYWHTGLDQAPEVVKLCRDSWAQLNPHHELVELDEENVSEHVDMDSRLPGWRGLPVQQQSDVLRLELLAAHGGIWVDATLLCSRPLAEWLPVSPKAGFSVFDTPSAGDKFFSSYFLAATRHSYFVSLWSSRLRRFLKPIPPRMSGKKTKRLRKRIPLLRTRLGHTLFTTRAFRNRFGSPYFTIHYIATRLLLTSPRSFLLWRKREPMVSGKFSELLRTPDPAMSFETDLRAKKYGAWKLTHKPLPDQERHLAEVMTIARRFLSSLQ